MTEKCAPFSILSTLAQLVIARKIELDQLSAKLAASALSLARLCLQLLLLVVIVC